MIEELQLIIITICNVGMPCIQAYFFMVNLIEP